MSTALNAATDGTGPRPRPAAGGVCVRARACEPPGHTNPPDLLPALVISLNSQPPELKVLTLGNYNL